MIFQYKTIANALLLKNVANDFTEEFHNYIFINNILKIIEIFINNSLKIIKMFLLIILLKL